MKRWTALLVIVLLTLGTGLAYADTATAGTFANFSSVTWSLFISDPLDDDVDGPDPGQDGRDIYEGFWWSRGTTYDYFRMDLTGAPHDTQYDWAVVYGAYLEGAPGGAPGTDSYVPTELTGIDWVVDWHPSPADVSADAILDPGSGGNQYHFHTWNGSSWTTTNLTASDYWVAFDDGDESPGNNTIQWRIPTASITTVYDFTGATHDLASDSPTTFDLTDTETVPEPTTMALMGLGIAGLAAFRRRRK